MGVDPEQPDHVAVFHFVEILIPGADGKKIFHGFDGDEFHPGVLDGFGSVSADHRSRHDDFKGKVFSQAGIFCP